MIQSVLQQFLHQNNRNTAVTDPTESHRKLIRTTSRGKQFPEKSEDDPDEAGKYISV